LLNYVTRRTENDVTQRSIQISANQPAQIRQVPVAMFQQMFKLMSPHSNADVCVSDRQRRRSLLLKPVKASSAIYRTVQRALGANAIDLNKLEKKV